MNINDSRTILMLVNQRGNNGSMKEKIETMCQCSIESFLRIMKKEKKKKEKKSV